MTKNVEFATFTQTVMITTLLLNTGSSLISSKTGSGINILYLLTGPITYVNVKGVTICIGLPTAVGAMDIGNHLFDVRLFAVANGVFLCKKQQIRIRIRVSCQVV